jgi:ATP-binding cassette subfamily C protein
LIYHADNAQSAGASLARIAGVILMPHELGTSHASSDDKTLTIDTVSHRYDAAEVVHAVSLRLVPGERVALVGQTGAGKSTLAAVAAGILPPTSGTVRLGDIDINTLDPAALRKEIVLLTQDVHVFSGTVAEDLRMVHPAADDDALRGALEEVGADWFRALPDGLATVVGEGAYALTPMQAQHLALARLILADPAIAILDEATAEAGSTGARELESAALAATAGRTALIVAHRLTQAETADRVIVLDDGRIIEHGTHAELVAAGGRYAELWQAWSTN